MKLSWSTLYLIVSGAACLVSCNLQQLQEAQRELASDTSTTTTTTGSCTDYSGYDTYSDCQTTTGANCTSEWKSFDGGGLALCYFPVAGWEICSTLTVDWIYTPYTETVCNVDGTNYKMARSVLGCQSSICACTGTPELIDDCVMSVTCPIPSPTPTPLPIAPPLTTPYPTPYYPMCT